MKRMPQQEIDARWAEGYRPFEIYVYNKVPVTYMGEPADAGEVSGWDIEHVFMKKNELKDYPFFDCIIGGSSVEACGTTPGLSLLKGERHE